MTWPLPTHGAHLPPLPRALSHSQATWTFFQDLFLKGLCPRLSTLPGMLFSSSHLPWVSGLTPFPAGQLHLCFPCRAWSSTVVTQVVLCDGLQLVGMGPGRLQAARPQSRCSQVYLLCTLTRPLTPSPRSAFGKWSARSPVRLA